MCGHRSIVAFMVIFAMPAVMLSSTMLLMDRSVNTHFFNPAEGGDAMLYQHLFWFFGHPEVYIIFIPGTGIVSTIIATFSRRRIFGYTALVLSHGRHRIYRLRAVGTSHVCHRPAADGRELLHRRQYDDCDSHRHPGLLLARDHVDRARSCSRRPCCGLWVSFSSS